MGIVKKHVRLPCPTRVNVALNNGAVVSVRATGTLDTVNTFFNNATAPGSSINISANNIDLLNSGFKTNTEPAAIDAGLEENSGIYTNASGNINFNATGKVTIDNSYVKNTLRNGSTGNTGGINIQANGVEIKNDGTLSTNLAGSGNVGDIAIAASGDVNLTNGSAISSDNDRGTGDSGKIAIQTTGNVNVIDSSYISSDNLEGKGNAGNIDIKTAGNINVIGTNDLSLIDGKDETYLSYITTQTLGKGNAGKITLDAKGDISFSNRSRLSSSIRETGEGNSQGIEIKNARNLNVTNQSGISSNNAGGTGNAGDIKIEISGNLNITGVTDPSFKSNPFSNNLWGISSETNGKGDTGKITIATGGDIYLNNKAAISSGIIEPTAAGNSRGIDIKNARNLTVANNSSIYTKNVDGIGNAGNIDIKTTGDINIIGLDPQSPLFTNNLNLVTNGFGSSSIISDIFNNGKGDSGKITIDTSGDINLINYGKISSSIGSVNGAITQGNSRGIEIKNARNLKLFYQSGITTENFQANGNAGNIDIKTSGDIKVIGADDRTFQLNGSPSVIFSKISTTTYGNGDTGKISIDTSGDIILSKNGYIDASISPDARGNSRGIDIKNASDLSLNNGGRITTSNVNGVGNAGDIDLKNIGNLTITNKSSISSDLVVNTENSRGNAGNISIQARGNIKIVAFDPQSRLLPTDALTTAEIGSSTSGKGNAGKISIDTAGDIEIANRGNIFTVVGETGQGNSGGVEIKNAGNLKIVNGSFIGSANLGGKGAAGNINIKTRGNIDIIGRDPQSQLARDYPNLFGSINLSAVSSQSSGDGQASNISISANRLNLQNRTIISSEGQSVGGGNITVSISDLLLLRNNSYIRTNSLSSQPNNNGGNITINSPLIVAIAPQSGIAANAVGGNGGRISITSQGIFGIEYVPKERQASLTGNFITSSSTFGRDGDVKIDTPGTDPGRDSTELPNATTDASNQISQACGASTRDNKLILAGRGGLPANADDPLTADVVWQDPRAASSQPAASNAPTNQLPPPAVGMVFDGKGKATLVAANTPTQPGTKAACPQAGK